MRTIGISIYPNENNMDKCIEYVEKAGKLGYSRIFSCLISASEDMNEVVSDFKKILKVANKYNMESIIDVSPVVFQKYNLTYSDLSFFKELGAQGIRLDDGIESIDAARMTYNKEHLKIEVNSSTMTKYIDDIIAYGANTDYLVSCHNFYPQKYSGLSEKHFNNCNKILKGMNLKISAFVSSQEKDAVGPWPVSEGVCTLEDHRYLDIDLQARHLFMLGADEVIIGNAFASDAELKAIADLERGLLTFKITEEYKLSDVEKEIVYEFAHFVRGDMSEYMARSTFSRITYKDADIQPNNTHNLSVGDIVVLNNGYGRYKGELHIVTKAMDNDGNKNVVGHLAGSEIKMLDFIVPWIPFKII